MFNVFNLDFERNGELLSSFVLAKSTFYFKLAHYNNKQ